MCSKICNCYRSNQKTLYTTLDENSDGRDEDRVEEADDVGSADEQ